MKQRSTTPVAKSFAVKTSLVTAAILMAVATPLAVVSNVRADKYDDQINAIQKQIDQYNGQASKLQNQANDLQQKLQALGIQKAQIQAQIDKSQLRYSQLKGKIAQTEKDITTNKDVLGDTLASLYVDGTISPLEMLASSNNIGDYVDKQEYQSSIRDELSLTIKKIEDLKTQLEKQKKDVERVLADQKNSRKALAAKEAEKQAILAKTQGKQSAYEQLSASSKAKQGKIREAQQAAIAARIASTGGSTIISSGAAGAYPWNNSNCRMLGYFSTGGADGNGGDGKGYGCRQCVSYAAWRMARETNYYPINWGNATNLPANARAAGYKTGQGGGAAKKDSLAVMHSYSAGIPEGHVGWVEDVVDGGASVIISQYNYNYGAGYGMYSKMKMSANAFDEYIYVK